MTTVPVQALQKLFILCFWSVSCCLFCVVSTCDCLERLVSKMTCYVSSGT